MPLEPPVIESIKQHNRSVRKRKLLLILPFLLAVLLGLVLLALSFLSMGHGSAGKTTNWIGLEWLVRALAALAFVYFCIVGYFVFANVRYALGQYQWFTTNAPEHYDAAGFEKFTDAVDGVSIAAGVETPTLVALDDPAANAVAFTGLDGRRWMGVTTGLLTADISVGEANGIAGHELAHVIIGQDVDPPRPSELEFLPSFLFVMFGGLACLAQIFNRMSSGFFFACALAVLVIWASLALLQRSQAYLMRQLDLASNHDDILADSIAVSLTHDPASLGSAIQKLSALAAKDGRMPGGTVMARSLFVTPPLQSGDFSRFATRDLASALSSHRQPRNWMGMHGPMNRAIMNIMQCEQRLTTERLTALDLIQQGRSRSVADWDRD